MIVKNLAHPEGFWGCACALLKDKGKGGVSTDSLGRLSYGKPHEVAQPCKAVCVGGINRLQFANNQICVKERPGAGTCIVGQVNAGTARLPLPLQFLEPGKLLLYPLPVTPLAPGILLAFFFLAIQLAGAAGANGDHIFWPCIDSPLPEGARGLYKTSFPQRGGVKPRFVDNTAGIIYPIWGDQTRPVA